MTSLLQELTDLQQRAGWLSHADLESLAMKLGVPRHRLESLASFYTHFRRSPAATTRVDVCRDVSCRLSANREAHSQFRAAMAARPATDVREVSCLGLCDRAPAARSGTQRFSTLPVEEAVATLDGPPTASGQQAVRVVDPAVLPALRADGYATLQRAVAQNAESLRSEISQAGLRGMGGAAFPTGRKWDLVADQPATPRYVICNADESEPGAFKDRSILAEFPHLVIEGVALAARAVGATKGWVFIRHEYDHERSILEDAITDAVNAGALGERIFGSEFSFELEVFVSPGGYILGEETALLECMQDRRGEPRNKPPLPGEVGLHGQPTLINNVETFAHAASILRHGCDWWGSRGRPGFSGHKFISVSGDVREPGVVLVPFGTPLRELLDLSGGMLDDKPLVAFSPGGASSNFLGPDALEVPVDFDALQRAGSMLGSGSAVFIAAGHSLLEIGLNITRFFHEESCGKCVPCRVGIQKALDRVGQATRLSNSDVELLSEIHATLERTSLCGLGQVALAPLLSLIRTFPEELREEPSPRG